MKLLQPNSRPVSIQRITARILCQVAYRVVDCTAQLIPEVIVKMKVAYSNSDVVITSSVRLNPQCGPQTAAQT